MSRIFIASCTSYGSAQLASVTVIKETPKTYTVAKETAEQLIGQTFVGSRYLKNDPGVFGLGEKAIDYLMLRLEMCIRDCENKLNTATQEQRRLVAIKEHVNEKYNVS